MKLKRLLILICTLVCCLCMGLAVVGCDDTPPNPDQNQGQTPGGETPGGETPGGETPGGETPGVDDDLLEPFEGNPPICLDHTWSEFQDVVVKTCTQDGKRIRTCSVCQRREVRTIKSTGHNLVEIGGKPATCTEGGYEKYEKCTICDYNTKVDEPALGHEFETVPAKDATCTEVGWTEYQRCTRSGCGYNTLDDEEVTDAHYIPLLEHQYESEDKDAPCKMCGKTRYIGSEGLEIVAAGSIARVVGIGSCKDTVITIPEEFEGKPVTEIDTYALSSVQTTDYYTWSDAKKKAFDEQAALLNKVTAIRMRGIQRISSFAFANLQSLTSIELGESLQRIGSNVFAMCPNLTEINIPESCSYIEGDAFFRCDGLRKITVDARNEFFKAIDDKYLVVMQTGELKYACYLGGLVDGELVDDKHEIPAEVKIIGSYAFAYHTSLREIVIPGTVETIDENAFYICNGLEKLTIEAGVKKIAKGAFRVCYNLTDVTIKTKEIKTEVEGQEVTAMSFESIGEGCFGGCDNLKTIKFDGTIADWKKVAKDGSAPLKGDSTATTGDSLLTIECKDGNLKERSTGDFVEA